MRDYVRTVTVIVKLLFVLNNLSLLNTLDRILSQETVLIVVALLLSF